VQQIQLIDSRSRFDFRTLIKVLVLATAALGVGVTLGRVMGVEQQVLALVLFNILLLTAFVAFYDITNAIILWFFALTCINRYTHLNLPGIPDMSGPRFMLVLMYAVFMIEFAMRRRRPLGPNTIELVMLVFVGVNFASMIQHENLVHTAARVSPITSFMNFTIFPFAIFYLVRNTSGGDRETKKLIQAFAAMQIYLALTGIFEHYRLKWLVFPPDILDPNAGHGRWYGVRARGPYLNSPIYGAAMGMGFFPLLHLFNYTRSRWRWAMLVGLLASPLACFYTLTRQVWIGLILPMLVGALVSRRQRLMVGLLALAALTFVFVVDPAKIIDPDVAKSRATDEATGQARIAHYVVGVHMFMDKPIFGHGIEMWEESWESYRQRVGTLKTIFGDISMSIVRGTHAHNTFLRLAVELGLVGLVPYLLILALIFRSSLRLYRRSAPSGFFGRELVLTFWQTSIAFLVCINFVDPSFHEILPGWLLAFAALIVRREELVRDPVAARTTPVSCGEATG
jgi:hypothetical protein